ncbi:AEC family transporter [Sphingomonas naphthae]|uniref:AEC family transporter n=1 Tax=Sphingomonas naphthae TaxID=1813468 RepID=A0ABY7TKI9_9SPHN|nr:AEC family transporter [Sphingomonas naphthae]WCT72895.1 AEC family transporter [Sphingomonas naphthae]
MILALGTVFPVFALILIGWAAGKRGILPATAVDGLNGFVVKLALPVLMFQFVAEADWRSLWHPHFVLALGGGMVLVFGATLLLARRQGLGEASIEALAAAYPNTAFMGIPIAQALFGAAGLAAAVIASLLTVCALFALTIMLVEYELHRERGLGHAALGVLRGLALNPLVFAPVLGGVWALTGIALPVPLHDLASLLGRAASPVALVTIGLFLAFTPAGGATARVAPLVLLKLVVQPLVTLLLVWLLAVPQPWGTAAILLAALPTGTGPFMVAALYRRDAAVIARVILVSTLISAATVSALVALTG